MTPYYRVDGVAAAGTPSSLDSAPARHEVQRRQERGDAHAWRVVRGQRRRRHVELHRRLGREGVRTSEYLPGREGRCRAMLVEALLTDERLLEVVDAWRRRGLAPGVAQVPRLAESTDRGSPQFRWPSPSSMQRCPTFFLWAAALMQRPAALRVRCCASEMHELVLCRLQLALKAVRPSSRTSVV